MNFSFLKILWLSLVIFIVGIISIVCGLGGGVILFPILTGLGMAPMVVSHSVLFMVFMSKIVTVLMNILEGSVVVDYAIFLGAFMTLMSILAVTEFN